MNNNIGVAVLDTGIYKHIDFGNRIIAFKILLIIEHFHMMTAVTARTFQA